MRFWKRPRSDRRILTLTRPPETVYAVGDIHGCADLYQRLETQVIQDAGTRSGRKLILCLGDMVDRGPHSATVLRQMQRALPEGISRICLAGNHEDMMCRFMDDPVRHRTWLDHGGDATLRSYGIAPDENGAYSANAALARRIRAGIPADDLAFLRSLPLAIEAADFVFAHAGYDLSCPAQGQDQNRLLWGPPGQSPDYSGSKCLIHGHVIVSEITYTACGINLDLGAYRYGRLAALRLDMNTGQQMEIIV